MKFRATIEFEIGASTVGWAKRRLYDHLEPRFPGVRVLELTVAPPEPFGVVKRVGWTDEPNPCDCEWPDDDEAEHVCRRNGDHGATRVYTADVERVPGEVCRFVAVSTVEVGIPVYLDANGRVTLEAP